MRVRSKREDPNIGTVRKKCPVAFKAKVCLEAIKEEKTSAELARQYGVHPAQVRWWRKTVKDGVNELFTDNHQRKVEQKNLLIEELHKEVGQLKVELEWLKKKCGFGRKGQSHAYRAPK